MSRYSEVTAEQWEKLSFTKDEIERQFDRVKAKVFRGDRAAFLGSLLCNINFQWTLEVETACTTGVDIFWNPTFFMSLPEETRFFALVHELWHTAYLHIPRQQDRDPEFWNYACDTVINSLMKEDGFTWEGFEPWYDPNFSWKDSSEEVYEKLVKGLIKLPKIGPFGSPSSKGDPGKGDCGQGEGPVPGKDVDIMQPMTPAEISQQVETVQKAVIAANMSGDPGSIPGEISESLDKFINPQLPWNQLLHRWFTDKMKTYRSFARPARRYLCRGLYMPSRNDEACRLPHVVWFLDSSGSMTDEDLIMTNSEAKFVWDVLKPRKMTIFNFDTNIHVIREFKEGDTFEDIEVKGRGGTDLTKVRQWLLDNKPDLCVIMSDMFVSPMEEGPKCPILWVCTSDHPGPQINVGTMIRMRL